MFFHVVGWPSAAGRRMAVGATDMNRYRQIVPNRRLIDRPVATASERLVGSRQDQDLRKVRVASPRIDLLHGGFGVFLRDKDRGPQSRLLFHPAFHLPRVHRPRERRAEVKIPLAARIQRSGISIPTSNPVWIEMLYPHQFETGPGRAAFIGIGIDPRRVRRHSRMRQRLGKGVTQMTAIDRKMVDPPLLEVRMNLGPRRHRGMNIAIDHPQFVFRPDWLRSISTVLIGQPPEQDRPWPVGDRVASAFSLRMLRSNGSGNPSGNAASPSNCQCG